MPTTAQRPGRCPNLPSNNSLELTRLAWDKAKVSCLPASHRTKKAKPKPAGSSIRGR